MTLLQRLSIDDEFGNLDPQKASQTKIQEVVINPELQRAMELFDSRWVH